MSLFAKQPAVLKVNGIQIQSAVQALPIPIIYGAPRVPCNIIYANGFHAVKQQQSGGKGLLTSGKGSNQYLYYATLIAAIGEGPIGTIIEVYQDTNQYFNLSNIQEIDPNNQTGKSGQPNYIPANAQFFPGGPNQLPWSYVTGHWPNDARSYKYTCYIGLPNMQLDSSGTPPQLNFVPRGIFSGTCPLNPASFTGAYTNNDGQFRDSFDAGLVDADPALVVNDFLTNPIYGAGFPLDLIDGSIFSSPAGSEANLGDNHLQTYCQAAGFGWSVSLNNSEAAGSIIDRWMRNLAVAIVWTGETLKFIPYLGVPYSVNPGFAGPTGVSIKYYRPLVTPLFNFTDSQFLQSRNPDEEPVTIDRIDPVDVYNYFRVSFKDRINQFNDNIGEDSDEVLMELYGPRVDLSGQADEFSLLSYAQQSATMQLRRGTSVRKHVTFRLPPIFGFLDPMDVVAITSGAISNLGVRITSIEEDTDGSLTIIAEDFPQTRVTAFLYETTPQNVFQTNTPVGDVNPPVIFEPTPQMLTAQNRANPSIAVALSGGPNRVFDPNWGGCRIWISLDNATYSLIEAGSPLQAEDSTQRGPATQGYLTADLAAFSGTNPDDSGMLSVDLSESDGELTSTISEVAAQLLTTLCVVVDPDGCYEILSYTIATLTGPNAYTLTGLYRGLYGTPSLEHLTGAQFARLDTAIFESNLPTQYVGVPLFLKFTSFNVYNGAEQDLSEVVAYEYMPTGAGIDYSNNPIVIALNAGLTVDLNLVPDSVQHIDLNLAGANPCSPVIFHFDFGGPVASTTKLYFEATLTAQASDAGFGIGIASADYQLEFPFSVSIVDDPHARPPQPTAAHGIVQVAGDTNYNGGRFGYPCPSGSANSFYGYNTLGMVMGCAIDMTTEQVWFCVLDGADVIWSNGGDPVAGTGGITYGGDMAASPISPPLYVVVGAYSANLSIIPGDANFAGGTVNFGATPFSLGPPTGYQAADSSGGTTLDPAMKSSQITLSGGNLSFTGTDDPPDAGVPFYAVLSNKPLRTS